MPVSLEPFALPERYRLERGIAAGGMASVYAAHDTVLDRPVAVKVLADHLNDDPVARQRFEREGRAAAALSSHPAVVTIFDVGEHNGRAFLVMERLDGGTLGDVTSPGGRSLRRPEGETPIPRRQALTWLHAIAGALDTAHAQGVVHRDIKPGNLLLDEQGRVAVADFGIASIASDTERFTQTGEVLGTAAYLSPEQAAGEPATAASDRYALAVVAYELLSGSKPFVFEHFAAQARAHIEDTPPPAPGLPRAAQEVLHRGLAKRPKDRWPSASAFVDALAGALEAPSPSPAPVLPVPDATTRALATRRNRSRAPLVLVGVGLIAAVVVALALAGGDDTPTQRTPAATPAAKAKKPKAKATPTPTAAQNQAPTAAPTTAAPTGDPAALNATGFDLLKQGDYAGAIGPLSGAVDACDGQGELDPCGYAYYNLGWALTEVGRTDEALQVLQARMDIWGDNPDGEVQQMIDRASGDTGAKAPKPGKGQGKAKGHDK
jgi:serine/threonine-protein kinase